MTLLVHTNAFPCQGSAQVGFFRVEMLPFLSSCDLNISSGPLTWYPKQITLCSKTSRLPFQKVQPVFTREENPQALNTPWMVGSLLMQFLLQACSFFIPSLILYVRTLGLGRLAQAAKCLGRGLSQVCQPPGSMLFLLPIGQSPRFLSSLGLDPVKNGLHA